MTNWRRVLCAPDFSIREGIRVITDSALQIGLVTEPDGKLIGIVTDGDIRRGILRGVSLDCPLSEIMNKSPTAVSPREAEGAALDLMLAKSLHHLPVVDEEGRVIGLKMLDHLLNRQISENVVVLMAGGLGSRLGELTKETPKPLLSVGNKPILETIIQNFKHYGFRRFYISINYLAEKVRGYFGDGSKLGVEIHYLEETKRLGTAGALSLLSTETDLPVLVMNGDVLTQVNFHHLMDFHCAQDVEATMCVREYGFQVPYGVARVEENIIVGIEEKPQQTFFINAGIYVLSPSLLSTIPKDAHYDMPQLFEAIIERKGRVGAFPVSEYWLDVGRVHDFQRANGEFNEVFEPR